MDNGASSYRRFLDGDDNSFVEIIRDYYDGLTLYLNVYVRNLSVAEELAEDTFVKLATKKPKFIEKSSFKIWLYEIRRNLVVDYIRHNAKNMDVSLDCCTELTFEEEEIEHRYIREEGRITLHRAMLRLKAEYRQVLWLTYFENLKAKETARIMKRSVHSVENLIYRARLSLKSELEREGFVYEELQ